MLISFKLTQDSIVLRIKVRNSGVSTGAGLTGLTHASAGLRIAAIADVEAVTVAYTQAGGTIETIATLGVYAAPTAGKCRFKEVDAANHPGIYELQLPNTRYSVASAKHLVISLGGAAGMAECDAVIPLTNVDPYSAAAAYAGAAAAVVAAIDAETSTLLNSIFDKTEGLPASWPANLALLSIDNAGKLALTKTGLDACLISTGGAHVRQAIAAIASAVAGKLSGAGPGLEDIEIKGLGEETIRLTVEADEDGNRTSVAFNSTMP